MAIDPRVELRAAYEAARARLVRQMASNVCTDCELLYDNPDCDHEPNPHLVTDSYGRSVLGDMLVTLVQAECTAGNMIQVQPGDDVIVAMCTDDIDADEAWSMRRTLEAQHPRVTFTFVFGVDKLFTIRDKDKRLTYGSNPQGQCYDNGVHHAHVWRAFDGTYFDCAGGTWGG